MITADIIRPPLALRNLLRLAADDLFQHGDGSTVEVDRLDLAALLRECADTYAELADRTLPADDEAVIGLAAVNDPAVRIANAIVDREPSR